MQIPQGLNIDKEKYVCKLIKAIYGLRISSKCWEDRLKRDLLSAGLMQSVSESCLYYRRETSSITLLITYVDDVLVASNDMDFVNYLFGHLQSSYNIKIYPDPKVFIGMQIRYEESICHLNQEKYITKMAKMFRLDTGKMYSTPMEESLRIEVSEEINDDPKFRALIGSLLYIARHTRPDIYYAVNKSRHQGHVTSEIFSYARRIGRYVYNTRGKLLPYTSDNSNIVPAFVDAAHATEEGARSCSGFLIFPFEKPCSLGNQTTNTHGTFFNGRYFLQRPRKL